MNNSICVSGLSKTYDNGFNALDNINLEVLKGDIFALLGPNGAGKTTLISSICGITKFNQGSVSVFGFDNIKEYRKARSLIGLVPQELTVNAFETVWDTVSFTRGLFGKPSSPEYIEKTLKKLSLWDKKDSQIRKLSGGMKRRVMIAKALSHEPKILFLDEPSSGVDVELRKSMWNQVKMLRESGVTVILTTHYIEEAEKMADRIAVINNGKIIINEEKNILMKKLGKKEVVMHLYEPIDKIPNKLSNLSLNISKCRNKIIFTYDPSINGEIVNIIDTLKKNDINIKDLETRQSSLEEIFVNIVGKS